MKDKKHLEFSNEAMECQIDGAIAILRSKANAFETLTNIEANGIIFKWFDAVEADPDIKVVIAYNSPGCYCEFEYNKFLSDLVGKELDIENPIHIKSFEKDRIRAIEINMLMNYIRKLIGFKKIVINALCGQIVTPFFGLSLAGDFRFAAYNMKYTFSHVKYGLHPSGALPFFLPRFLGHPKSEEYLFRGGEIPAIEAKSLGLVNETVPQDRLEEYCMQEAKKLCELDVHVIRSTKNLLCNFEEEFERYIERESKYKYS